MSAYLHAFRLHTIYPAQPFDADNGCNNQYSADYCYGWLKAATFFHTHDCNNTRTLEEAWTLGWVHTNRQNYNGEHIFYPCSADNLFCSVYLQGEVQGYTDRIESAHNHTSIINTISRVCLGMTDYCTGYYNEHPWYSNLVSYKYDKMEKKLELKRNHAYALLKKTGVNYYENLCIQSQLMDLTAIRKLNRGDHLLKHKINTIWTTPILKISVANNYQTLMVT